jgi:26S proteasome regulatory subunit, ATPase 3, interacting protein
VKAATAGTFLRDRTRVIFTWMVELAKLKSTPTDSDLDLQVSETAAAVSQRAFLSFGPHHDNRIQIEKIMKHVEPLRAGSALICASDLTQLDSDWKRWRQEWTRRRKIFITCMNH